MGKTPAVLDGVSQWTTWLLAMESGVCPNADIHKDPNAPCHVGTTAHVRDPVSGRMVLKTTSKVVRYADWSGRCRICWPRVVST